MLRNSVSVTKPDVGSLIYALNECINDTCLYILTLFGCVIIINLISSWFSINSKASTSELLVNLEEMSLHA